MVQYTIAPASSCTLCPFLLMDSLITALQAAQSRSCTQGQCRIVQLHGQPGGRYSIQDVCVLYYMHSKHLMMHVPANIYTVYTCIYH